MVVGVAAAVFEAALLPGLVLGVAAMLVPKAPPGVGASLNPLFRSTVRAAYKIGHKTKEMMTEAHEHVNDIVAEMHAEARLACLEVFGLGAKRTAQGAHVGYFASRILLSRLVNEASALLLERGVAGATSPIVAGLVSEIAQRFGVVVAERASTSVLPMLGALGGASVNYLFMTHFQRVAHGHFSVRRLERHYGAEAVRGFYQDLAARVSAPPRAAARMEARRLR